MIELRVSARPENSKYLVTLMWSQLTAENEACVRTEDRLTGYVTLAGASSKASLFRNKTSYQGMLQYTHSSGNKISIYYLSLWFYAMQMQKLVFF